MYRVEFPCQCSGQPASTSTAQLASQRPLPERQQPPERQPAQHGIVDEVDVADNQKRRNTADEDEQSRRDYEADIVAGIAGKVDIAGIVGVGAGVEDKDCNDNFRTVGLVVVGAELEPETELELEQATRLQQEQHWKELQRPEHQQVNFQKQRQQMNQT